MEIALVYKEIQQLLIKDESVTLPKVGKFEIVSTPATFLEDCRTILPPKKELVFSFLPDEGKNDICESWQQELANEILSQLQQNGAFEVPGFGKFSKSETGEITFAVSEEFDFAPDSFSLEAISLEVNPVQDPGEVAQIQEKPQDELQENPQPQKEDEPAPQPAVLPEEPKNASKWLVWALVAAVAVLAVVLFIILFKEQFAQMVRDMLYTEEELQIIEQWKQGYIR